MKRDYKDIKKELGDVLEHVMFYSIIGREDGEFDICDVCNQEADKLMFRHPSLTGRKREIGRFRILICISTMKDRLSIRSQMQGMEKQELQFGRNLSSWRQQAENCYFC